MQGGWLGFYLLEPVQLPLPFFAEHLLVYDFVALGDLLVHLYYLCSWDSCYRSRLPSFKVGLKINTSIITGAVVPFPKSDEVYCGEDGDEGAENRGEEGEEAGSSPVGRYILPEHDPAISIRKISDGPECEEDEGDEGEDVEDASGLVFLHVDTVGDVEDVEGDGEEYQGYEEADKDAHDSVFNSG